MAGDLPLPLDDYDGGCLRASCLNLNPNHHEGGTFNTYRSELISGLSKPVLKGRTEGCFLVNSGLKLIVIPASQAQEAVPHSISHRTHLSSGLFEHPRRDILPLGHRPRNNLTNVLQRVPVG